MASYTSEIVPPFDFEPAEKLSVAERFRISLDQAKQVLARSGYAKFCRAPCIPPRGASDAELNKLESELEVSLPAQYRKFLATYRYLLLDDGCEVGGVDYDGLYVTERPWISTKHRKDVKYLVFANYWHYADGDQLMFDLTDPSSPVIAFLHDHGPLFEFYAPSFSLALWRLVHEIEPEED